ncbi:MAG: alkaline phosphatase family protein [Acidobacteriota bacterium]
MRLITAFLAAAAFCASGFSQTPAKGRMVVVISLDGLPASVLQDSKAPIPTLRRLIANGVTATMTPLTPTITWPNHTTMVTGVRADEHGLLTNGTITRTGSWPPVKVEPMLDKEKMVHAPTVYDAARRAGLTTAQVDWVAINNAPGITWAFSEWATAEGPLEREMIAKGVVSAAELENFSNANILFRDEMWTRAAAYLIREHKPNLLLYHLLSLDSVHHRYGPGTLAGTSAIAFLDSCVARVVEAVAQAGMTERTTFLVVSDHGFKAYTKQIRAGAALAAAGLDKQAYVLPEGGTGYVYLDKARAAEIAPKVIAALEGVEGIARIIRPEGYAELGLAQPERDPQMFDLLLVARSGYAFSGATGGPVTAELPQQAGSHGYLASDPEMTALFIASGYGVARGAKLERFENIDIAPTIANLLGIALPSAKGKPLALR